MAKRYGTWEVVASIGQGGQSHVFKVRSIDSNQPGEFALKRLKNENRIARFRDEISAISAMDHVSIVKLINFELEGTEPFLVTPYYANGDLVKARAWELPLRQRLKLFAAILEAIAYAHRYGAVHRDLKPANILLTDTGLPVVADWGIAFVEDGHRVTLTEEAVGARNYIPPEAESGRLVDVSGSFDVYSLGKILYWLMTGRDLVREYHRQPAYDLSKQLGESRFEAITGLLDKCLAEQPTSRFKDAAELREAFIPIAGRIEKYVNYPSAKLAQRCIYCGVGEYEPLSPLKTGEGQSDRRAFNQLVGIVGAVMTDKPEPGPLRAMICNTCGNVQLFRVETPLQGAKKKPLPDRPWRQTSE